VTSYSDIPLSFRPHPVTGDIGRLVDEDAVAQSIKLLVLTNLNERLAEPTIGGNVVAHLFEHNTAAASLVLRSSIETCLRNSEVRAEVVDVGVAVNPDGNDVHVSVMFKTQQMLQPATVSIQLERVR